MGGQAEIPRSTESFQAYTPNKLDWANYKLKKQLQDLQMQYYKPLLADTLERRSLYKGVLNNDPESLRQFSGMPQGATQQQVLDRINAYRGRGTPNPTMPNPQMPAKMQNAAKGGIMQLRGYSNGKKVTLKPAPKNETPEQRYKRFMDFENAGGKLNNTQKQYVANYNEYDDNIEKGGYSIDYKTGMPVAPKLPSNATKAERDAANKKFSDATGLQVESNGKVTPIEGWKPPVEQGTTDTTTPNPHSELEANQPPTYGVIAGPNPSDPIQFTDPWVNKTLEYVNQMQAPSEWGQASGYYNTAAQGLQSLAGYTPQQVAAERASAQQGAAERASASQMGAIKDVSADRVNLGQYNINAAQMQRPEDVTAQQIEARNILGAQMQRPEDVQAQALQRYQMDATAPISTQDLEAYQMAGPGSWTDEGVSSKYMSPYMQGVVDITKREAERDYTKQMNALAAKAKSAGAFGGARQALERSEAQRNYNQQLQDIQTRGMQQAYESGRSQYGQELSLSQQAALSNLQSKLSTQSQSSQQALQALLANQNIDYQTKLQNLQAMLGVQSQEAQQMLNASLANQQAGLTTGQQNLQAEMQKQLANQQAGMTSQQANQQAALQAALANQQSGLTSSQINAQLAQQAALANQGVGVQGDLANQQAALQAALANQQTQFGVGSLNANLANQVALQNAQLGTQASMTNAQLGTQANLANAANALQAGMANQAAGLQGNQQNIAAYNALGNMGQGLAGLGQQQWGQQMDMFNNLGGIASQMMNLGQGYWNNQQQGNQGVVGGSQMPPKGPS